MSKDAITNEMLIKAVRDGSPPIKIDRLIAIGANPNAVDPKTRLSVLITACINGNLPAVKVLIKRGANLDEVGDNAFAAIQFAQDFKQIAIVEELIFAGAKVPEFMQKTYANEIAEYEFNKKLADNPPMLWRGAVAESRNRMGEVLTR